MKTEMMSMGQFLNDRKEKEGVMVKVDRHFKKYSFAYKVAGATAIFLLSCDPALAATGSIGAGAKKLYYDFVFNIGKWIIVFKGGIDTIKAAGSGDFEGAKKSFFSYLLVYLFLLAFPLGLEKIDEVFRKV